MATLSIKLIVVILLFCFHQSFGSSQRSNNQERLERESCDIDLERCQARLEAQQSHIIEIDAELGELNKRIGEILSREKLILQREKTQEDTIVDLINRMKIANQRETDSNKTNEDLQLQLNIMYDQLIGLEENGCETTNGFMQEL